MKWLAILLAGLVGACGTTPPSAPRGERTPAISGAFFQLNPEMGGWNRDEWGRELDFARQAGINTILVQYAIYTGVCHFPCPPEMVADMDERFDSISHLMDAAGERGMEVYLGLQLDHSFWEGEFDPAERIATNSRVLDELRALYGDRPALAGWYLPEEISDVLLRDPEAFEAMAVYLGGITAHIRESGGLPAIISPYFGVNPNPAEYAADWDRLLERVDLDIFALQDGVGTRRTTIAEGAAVFKALAPVMERHGVAFWANVEVFDLVHGWPIDDKPWSAAPATADRVLAQMEAAAPHTTKTIIFDFPHYLSPREEGPRRTLYEGLFGLPAPDSAVD